MRRKTFLIGLQFFFDFTGAVGVRFIVRTASGSDPYQVGAARTPKAPHHDGKQINVYQTSAEHAVVAVFISHRIPAHPWRSTSVSKLGVLYANANHQHPAAQRNEHWTGYAQQPPTSHPLLHAQNPVLNLEADDEKLALAHPHQL